VNRIILILFVLLQFKALYGQVVDTVCIGEQGVSYKVNHNPGSIYYWKVEGGQILSGEGTSAVSVNWGFQPGTFRISVLERNSKGCAGDSVHAYVLVRDASSIPKFPPEACLNDIVKLEVIGGSRFAWSNGDSKSVTYIKLLSDTNISVIVSKEFCAISFDTLAMQIKANPLPQTTFTTSSNGYSINTDITFYYTGDKSNKVFWDFEKASISSSNSPVINLSFIDTGLAKVMLYVISNKGCRDSSIKEFEINDEHLFMPNAFTPNNDKLNDDFRAVTNGIKAIKMEIFNPWGEMVFETSSLNQGWDGTFKGQAAQNGVYSYVVWATGNSDKNYTFYGNLTLIR